MSMVSNHFPEVIDEINGHQAGRPVGWDVPPDESDLDQMAVYFGVEDQDGVAVPREALAAYEAANNRLWGFLDGFQVELNRAVGPCTMERLARQLRAKLAEMDAVARQWASRKYAV